MSWVVLSKLSNDHIVNLEKISESNFRCEKILPYSHTSRDKYSPHDSRRRLASLFASPSTAPSPPGASLRRTRPSLWAQSGVPNCGSYNIKQPENHTWSGKQFTDSTKKRQYLFAELRDVKTRLETCPWCLD